MVMSHGPRDMVNSPLSIEIPVLIMWGNSSGPGFTAGDEGGEVSDVRTLGQHPLWCLYPVNTLPDECG